MTPARTSVYAMNLQVDLINTSFDCGETPVGPGYLDVHVASLAAQKALGTYIGMLEGKVRHLGGNLDEVINAHRKEANNENPV